MGLGVVLNNALSSLNVNQQSLAVLSQNIANANTPGYSKQTLVQQAMYLDGAGAGVSVQDVSRKVDQYLLQSIQSQSSVSSETSTLSDYANRVQLLLGQPNSGDSLDSFTTDYFNALQALATTPNGVSQQQDVVNAATTLASQTQQLAQGIEQLRYQSDQDIGTAVANVNHDLTTIYNLNNSIVSAKTLGQSTSGLEDSRDTAVQDLSKYLGIQTFTKDNGEMDIATTSGVSLLDSGQYQLSYTPASGVGTFINNSALNAITVQSVNQNGEATGTPVVLATANPSSKVTSSISGGSIGALLSLRDQQLPDMLSQLDNFASNLRDSTNAIQNAGTSYPGSNALTGTSLVSASDFSQWSGSVNIAVLGANGQAVPSPYADEPNGVPPLTINLASLNTGQGAGNPSVQGIINEINQYYGAQGNKAEVGNLNNVRLASDSTNIPGAGGQFSFDFDLENISSTPANFYVTNVTVQDSNNDTIPAPTSTIPSISIKNYVTTASNSTVTVNTNGTNNNLTNGETVYLSNPGTVDGTDVSGFFTVSNVTATSFQISAIGSAGSGGTFTIPGQTALPPYTSVDAGEATRTSGNGMFTANLSGSAASASSYTVTATVAVDDGSGNIKTSQITYQVNNNQSNILNQRYSAASATDDGKIVVPTSSQPIAQASLVDANGNQLPIVNGAYTTTQQGYLQIKATNSSNVIAINSMDSSENGQPNNNPPIAGTGRGFSYYFNLNDFFDSPDSSDTTTNSALNLAVEQRLIDNPALVSTGVLTQSATTSGTAYPNYTYEVNSGDGTTAQNMADLGNTAINFAAAGDLGVSQESFVSYAGQIISSASTAASVAQTNSTNAQTLLTGFQQQEASTSGVNLDDELANTVIYQNAYTASARVITVVNTLFDALLQSFTGQ